MHTLTKLKKAWEKICDNAFTFNIAPQLLESPQERHKSRAHSPK